MKARCPRSLREFVCQLKQAGELVEVRVPVQTRLELAEIHRRVSRTGGPALLFSQVSGSAFPVVSNLFGSPTRIELAFGADVHDRLHRCLRLLTQKFPPSLWEAWKHRREVGALLRLGIKKKYSGPILDRTIENPDLHTLPFIQCWPEDGGQFLTLPIVATSSPRGLGNNFGIYRIQRFDSTTTGLHWQIAKGGAVHYKQAEELGIPLPITIYLGGPPALIASAIAPLPENCSELLLASFLLGSKVAVCGPQSLLAECDIALIGQAFPFERRREGPFGDHYGYQDHSDAFPVFHCSKIFHRKDAIVPATVVGKPLQEDAWIGGFIQKLLKPCISFLVPAVEDIYTYPETGFHPLAAVRIQERYEREALPTAFRLLGEGQLALTKVLLLTDATVPLHDIRQLLPCVLERIRPEKDLLIIPDTANDTLDMTGPKTNRGSKAIFIATGAPKRKLADKPPTDPPPFIAHARCFAPGCLVIDGPSYEKAPDPQYMLTFFHEWALVVLVDDAVTAASSPSEFLWHACTRFDPARDLFSLRTSVQKNGVIFSLPILIDARFKPSYQKPLEPDPFVAELVDRRWHEYFS